MGTEENFNASLPKGGNSKVYFFKSTNNTNNRAQSPSPGPDLISVAQRIIIPTGPPISRKRPRASSPDSDPFNIDNIIRGLGKNGGSVGITHKNTQLPDLNTSSGGSSEDMEERRIKELSSIISSNHMEERQNAKKAEEILSDEVMATIQIGEGNWGI
ncbi:hypothetical protein L1987_83658 [Smallanthus sonchifolius]|uniref:Uncharacterized protein n=1 Tax=Smallanthus sonchifolius TaxID=185202 RepID=A0ACB8YDG2_9ASTR|nr:hypothetical protein L1987_83658 [Smallanthus sonchifolius]